MKAAQSSHFLDKLVLSLMKRNIYIEWKRLYKVEWKNDQTIQIFDIVNLLDYLIYITFNFQLSTLHTPSGAIICFLFEDYDIIFDFPLLYSYLKFLKFGRT